MSAVSIRRDKDGEWVGELLVGVVVPSESRVVPALIEALEWHVKRLRKACHAVEADGLARDPMEA